MWNDNMPVLLAGISVPQTVPELIWYCFGLLGAYFLWSIKRELVGLRTDVKEEMQARIALDLRLTKMEARCELHKRED